MDMIRGDTKNLKFRISVKSQDGTYWSPSNGDKVYLTFKKDYFDNDVVIQKIYPTDINFNSETKYFTTTILPKNTNKLDMNTKYVYDIEIKSGSTIKTVGIGELNILPEVTSHGNEV